MLRIEGQEAYILHSRPYRETSLILEFFTPEYGRLAAIGRSSKRQGKGILQPFVPLLISCSGSRELLTLKGIEAAPNSSGPLQGRYLISALYLNELLVRLLHPRDPYPDLFQIYCNSLLALANLSHSAGGESEIDQSREEQQAWKLQKILRFFEKSLLKALGYEPQLTIEINSDRPVEADCLYFFDPERGPRLAERAEINQGTGLRNEKVFKGSSLLALAADALTDGEVLQDAKQLMRLSLARHLGHRPLETRKLLS